MRDEHDLRRETFCAVLCDITKELASDRRVCRARHARGELMLGVETLHHLACDDLGPAVRAEAQLRRRCHLRAK